MEYRIYEFTPHKYVVQVKVTEIVGGFAFWKKYETSWFCLNGIGEAQKNINWAKSFDKLDDAKDFLAWCYRDKVVNYSETFSAPITVTYGDGNTFEVPATANFRVDRVDTPPEDYKGDVIEVSVVEEPEEEVGTPSPSENFGFAPVNRKARAKYDRDKLEADIRDGELTSSQLLEKYSISAPTLSKVRKEMGYGRTKKEKPAPKTKEMPVVVNIENPAVNLDAEIKLLFVRGFKVQEVSDMYPMVPLDRIIRLKGDAIR